MACRGGQSVNAAPLACVMCRRHLSQDKVHRLSNMRAERAAQRLPSHTHNQKVCAPVLYTSVPSVRRTSTRHSAGAVLSSARRWAAASQMRTGLRWVQHKKQPKWSESETQVGVALAAGAECASCTHPRVVLDPAPPAPGGAGMPWAAENRRCRCVAAPAASPLALRPAARTEDATTERLDSSRRARVAARLQAPLMRAAPCCLHSRTRCWVPDRRGDTAL
jgi:hypothetical protein